VDVDLSLNSDAPILVIGTAGVDVVGRLKRGFQPGTSSPANIRFSFGGVARNVAENLSRLGQEVRLITAVGSGYFGDQLLNQLADAGVDASLSIRTKQSTGSYIAVLSGGEKQFALDDMRAIDSLKPAYLRENYQVFKDSSLLFIDANLPKPVLKTVFSLAKRARLPVVADPTSTSLAGRLKVYLPQIFMITPNSAEAGIYCDSVFDDCDQQQAIETAKLLVSDGVEVAIITLSEFGVCYATTDTSGFIPAIHTDITDPTGAADALTATVMFGLLNEMPLDDAIRLGVSAASLTLRHNGAVVPDLSLEKLYNHLII
jgi:pseudouridine kinase